MEYLVAPFRNLTLSHGSRESRPTARGCSSWRASQQYFGLHLAYSRIPCCSHWHDSFGAGLGFRRERRHLISLQCGAAASGCSPAIQPKGSGPSTCQRCCFLMEANGWQASTVALFKQARRRSQGVAELGYVSLQCVRFMAARILPSVQQRS